MFFHVHGAQVWGTHPPGPSTRQCIQWLMQNRRCIVGLVPGSKGCSAYANGNLNRRAYTSSGRQCLLCLLILVKLSLLAG